MSASNFSACGRRKNAALGFRRLRCLTSVSPYWLSSDSIEWQQLMKRGSALSESIKRTSRRHSECRQLRNMSSSRMALSIREQWISPYAAKLTENLSQLAKVVCFNYLIGNCDAHPNNNSIMYQVGKRGPIRRLSPAYLRRPSPIPVTSVGRLGFCARIFPSRCTPRGGSSLASTTQIMRSYKKLA